MIPPNPLRTLAAALLLAGTVRALPQSVTVLRAGDPPFALPVSLPAAGVSGDADHGTVAVNSAGDLCVVWHTKRLDLAGTPAQVEAAVLPHLGGDRWAAPLDATSGLLFLVGDPSVHVLQTQVHEACRKPDVVAVGEEFVVAWPRTPLGSHTAGVVDSRLEACRIYRDPVSGSWQVDAEAPGVGWELDGLVSNGAGGVMPDLASGPGLGAREFLAAYVHATREALPERDFDLRLARVDFSVSPPLVLGRWTLVQGVPLDDAAGTGGPSGGKVLPDVVLDDQGRLILAYEAYAVAGHRIPGVGRLPNGQGRIVVERWDLAGGAPQLLERWDRYGSDPGAWQRRPNLATSRLDRKDSVSLAWMEQAVTGGDTDTWHQELTLPATGGGNWTDLAFPNRPWLDHRLPAPVHGRDQLRACWASEGVVLPRRGVAWLPLSGRLLELPPRGMDKWRFAADLWETATDQVMATTFESTTGLNGEFRIQVILRR